MKRIAVLVLLTAALLPAARAHAQQTPCPFAAAGAQRCMYFTLERIGAAYTLVLRDDGKALYWEGSGLHSGPGQTAWMSVSAPTVKTIFDAEPSMRAGSCMAHTRVGLGSKKTLTAWSPQGQTTCSFVTAEDPTVSAAANALTAMIETAQAGKRLDRDHHSERLALEGELDSFAADVQSGKAIEVPMIAPVLKSIVDDDTVIDRLRQKAAALLQPSAAAPSAR